MPTPYDSPDRVRDERTEQDALIDELGETINVLLTGRRIDMAARARLVSALLDIAEHAGLRAAADG